ncbi:MAG: YfhO family protein [Gemmiger sp.]
MSTPRTIRPPKSRYWQVFLLCLLVAAALFLPHCIIDGVSGDFFHYAGDFNDQQIPFYSYANAFVKQGGSYSWATDLGSGFLDSYSFYLCGSPFFWLSLLLPSRLTPWFMVPMLCLKFAVAGGGAYLWMRRWVRKEPFAVVGACLYAFSGFSVYNIFFNHFLDVVALFPYLLASLDDAMLDGRRGPFSFWVAVNLLNNYFFFAGQAVFLVIYFVCMCVGRRYRLTAKRFGAMAWQTLLGCAMGFLLVWPAWLSLRLNPRTIDPFDGYGYLVYNKAQQYLAIFFSAFLMPEAPYLTDLFSEGVLKWTSMSAYLPLVGIAGGLVYCRRHPRSAFTHILKCCVVCAFVPVLNSMFYAFNSSYYARWYYMPLLVLCAATAQTLGDDAVPDAEWKSAVRCMGLVVLGAAAFALVPATDADGNFKLGVVDNQPRFWGLWAMTMLGVVLFALMLHQFRGSSRWPSAMLAAVLAFSFLYGTLHLSYTKYGQWYHDADYVQQTWREADALNAALDALDGNDESFYRIDAYECYNNMGLWLDRSCIQFFNSTVSPSIMEFYPTVGVTRDVNSKPKPLLYALRGLLGVRYTLVPTEKDADWQEENLAGWTLSGQAGSYNIYENENYVPLGTAYDYYITADQLEHVVETERGNVLMKALVLTEEQIETYGDCIRPLPEDQLKRRTYAEYTNDCAARRDSAERTVVANDHGFTADVTLTEEKLVLFAVPWDEGFSVTVNGQPAVLEKVDNGLSAVRLPAGQSHVECIYHTPGLKLSAAVTGAGWAVWVVYLGCLHLKKQKKKEETAE